MNVTVKVGLFSPCFQFLCVAVEGDMTKKIKTPKLKHRLQAENLNSALV